MEITNRTGIEKTALNGSQFLSIDTWKINRITLIKICYNLLFAHSMMSHLSCRVGMRGIRELLDGKIWEWDLSFRREWEWSHLYGRELVRKICSRTPLLQICCTDVTASCANNDAANIYVLLMRCYFAKESIIFLNILRQNIRMYLGTYIYHSIDYGDCEYTG